MLNFIKAARGISFSIITLQHVQQSLQTCNIYSMDGC